MEKLFASVIILNLGILAALAGGDQKDAAKIEGRWKLTASVQKGTKVADKEIADAAVVVAFKDGRYTFTYKGAKGDVGTYKLDAKAKPMNIDLTLTEDNRKGETQHGIYKLEAAQVTPRRMSPGVSGACCWALRLVGPLDSSAESSFWRYAGFGIRAANPKRVPPNQTLQQTAAVMLAPDSSASHSAAAAAELFRSA